MKHPDIIMRGKEDEEREIEKLNHKRLNTN